MAALIIRRILQMIVVLFFVSIIVFLIMQLLPGDPARIMLGSQATEEQIELFRQEMGLDKPLPIQYLNWLGGVLQGDLGRSVVQRDDVSKMIGERLPITLQLGIYSLLCSILIGVPAGVMAAVKRGSVLDSFILFVANTGLAMPSFWLAILTVYIFSMNLGWLPVQGYVPLSQDFWGHVKHMVLPVLALSTSSLAMFARQTRSAMLEVIRQDYIRTARAKGLRENYVILKHALRNALLSIITLLGLVLGQTIGFTVLIETVFNIPGLSRLLVQSIFSHDYVVVQGCVLIIALLVSVVNLLVDLSYQYADPKIRYD